MMSTFGIILVLSIYTVQGQGTPDTCNPGDCLHYGACLNLECTCSSPYVGSRCQNVDVDATMHESGAMVTGRDTDCTTHVCMNGGDCWSEGAFNERYFNYEDSYISYSDVSERADNSCLCRREWEGTHCSKHVCNDYCQNGGECMPLGDLPGPQCRCNGNTTGPTCQYRCEDHCVHFTSCHESNEHVFCSCPAGHTGQSCETNLNPEFHKITPGYGPIAGGTTISLNGDQLENVDIISMTPYCGTGCPNYATIIYNRANMSSQTPNQIMLNSRPSTQYGFGGQPERLVYNVSYQSFTIPATRNTTLQFEYRPNPIIIDIYPRRTILEGGIKLTAIGQNLDSVHAPIFHVYVERRETSGDSYQVISTSTFTATDVTVYNGSAMLCPTPTIDLTVPQRKRRQAGDATPQDATKKINNEELEFYIGFTLDGIETYTNISETNPQAGRLIVYRNPTFETFDGTRSYNPKTEDFIDIKGESLTLGASMEDYTIELGKKKCEMTELSDNFIICTPPKSEPGILKEGAFKDGKPRIYVNTGYYRFAVGHIDYVKDWTLYIIIGSVVGGVLLLVIIGIIIYCCCVRKNRKADVTSGKETQRQPQSIPMLDTENAAVRQFKDIVR